MERGGVEAQGEALPRLATRAARQPKAQKERSCMGCRAPVLQPELPGCHWAQGVRTKALPSMHSSGLQGVP